MEGLSIERDAIVEDLSRVPAIDPHQGEQIGVASGGRAPITADSTIWPSRT